MSYSNDQLRKLAQSDAAKFIKILNNPSTETYVLTFGAEILGEEITDEAISLPVFRKLLRHINATVREGALIGLMTLFFDRRLPSDILERVRDIAKNDPSPALKLYAEDILKDY
jgi:hypothetical protein